MNEQQHKKSKTLVVINTRPLFEALGIVDRYNGEALELDIDSAVFAYIDEKFALLEDRIKELEDFRDEILVPSHREPEIKPKVEEHVQKPSSSELRDEDTETRKRIIKMERDARLARRK